MAMCLETPNPKIKAVADAALDLINSMTIKCADFYEETNNGKLKYSIFFIYLRDKEMTNLHLRFFNEFFRDTAKLPWMNF